jgi:uncharacterized protein
MPGSMTISHTDALVMLSHADAERLATVLREMCRLLEQPGADRLSDAQVQALCEDRLRRNDLADWSRRLSGYLEEHL